MAWQNHAQCLTFTSEGFWNRNLPYNLVVFHLKKKTLTWAHWDLWPFVILTSALWIHLKDRMIQWAPFPQRPTLALRLGLPNWLLHILKNYCWVKMCVLEKLSRWTWVRSLLPKPWIQVWLLGVKSWSTSCICARTIFVIVHIFKQMKEKCCC